MEYFVIWLGLGLPVLALALFASYILWWHVTILRVYLPYVLRIFQERPIFIVPFGKPSADAEEVSIPTTNQLTLRGCYLRAHGPRKGVILFGLEFATNRWSCQAYCEFLRSGGYDVFTFEVRGQGDSPAQPGYEPLQWVTEFEVEDFRAALDYLKNRPDADPRGIGFFGLSKGASAAVPAARESQIRCLVTDGMFGAYATMIPYMKKWIYIYVKNSRIAHMIPTWYYRHIATIALDRIEKERGCQFHELEKELPHLGRPLLMIHGAGDNYIKPEMAEALFEMASSPKALWIVEGAKHNQAIHQAAAEYQRRVLAFFDEHLGGLTAQPVLALQPAPSGNGVFVGEVHSAEDGRSATPPYGVTIRDAASRNGAPAEREPPREVEVPSLD